MNVMAAELERLARVAVGHGRDDPAVDLFLVFVGALNPLPDAATLGPAARRIGRLRLAQALDRPGEPRLGACRLLAAACVEPPRPVAPPAMPAEEPGGVARHEPEPPLAVVGSLSRPGGARPGPVTVERALETGRRLPELFEALVHAIRVALSLFV